MYYDIHILSSTVHMPQIPVEQEPVQSLDVHATYVLHDLLEWIHESARPAVATPLSVNIVLP